MTEAGRFGRRLQEGSLYVLLFLLPFSKAAVEIGFGLLLLGWVLLRWDPATRGSVLWRRRPWRGAVLAAGAFVAAAAASIAVSRHPDQSWSGLVNKWLEYLAFTAIVADLAVSERVVRRSIWVLAASSVFVVMEGLSQEWFGKGFIRGGLLQTYWRMMGPYESPSDLGTYLMVLIPLVVFLRPALASRRLRVALGVWSAVLLACFARTETLGAGMGLLSGLAIGGVWSRQPAVRRTTAVLLGAIAVFGAGALLWSGHLRDTLSQSEIGKTDRHYMWAAAIRMIQDRPLLGHGLNTFMSNYLDYWVGGERMPRYAHNCYLQMAAETGLIGCGAFLWLLAALFARMAAVLRGILGRQDAVLAGLFAALTAFAVHAGVDTNFYSLKQSALFWIVLGLAVGRCEALDAPPRG